MDTTIVIILARVVMKNLVSFSFSHAVTLVDSAALATTKTACVMNPDLNIWFIYHVLYDCEWDFYDDLFAAITKKGSSLTLAESCP